MMNYKTICLPHFQKKNRTLYLLNTWSLNKLLSINVQEKAYIFDILLAIVCVGVCVCV